MQPWLRFKGLRPYAVAFPLGPYGRPWAARGMARPYPYYKSGNMFNVGYWCLESLRECLYLLLCCWCLKEILD